MWSFDGGRFGLSNYDISRTNESWQGLVAGLNG
jgi:hypothetical protein